MPDNCSERWVPVPGFDGQYEVSDRGRVRRPARLLALSNAPGGYRRVTLSRGNKGYGFLLHRLVMLAFVGPCPPDHEVDHRDADKTNNRLANLEYVTRPENLQRSMPRRRATQVRGERAGRAKLTAADVRELRRLAAAGVGYRALARRYGLAYPTARNIVLRERWAHVE